MLKDNIVITEKKPVNTAIIAAAVVSFKKKRSCGIKIFRVSIFYAQACFKMKN